MKLPTCLLLFAASGASFGASALGIVSTPVIRAKKNARVVTPVNPDMTGIVEEACLETARKMQRIAVPISTNVHPSGQVEISHVHWPATTSRPKSSAKVILVHGFDSSCLEYRRLGARLAARGLDTYAVDLLGWGFSQLDGVQTFSAEAKIQALESFVNTVTDGGQYVIAGASLGGAAAIEVAAAASSAKDEARTAEVATCQGLILIDAQGFVDGIGPMASMPKPVAGLGVEILKSVPLRSSANQMSYFDKATFATDEAVVVGRLHCLQQAGWKDALVSFMQSGGFSPSAKVSTIQAPALVLWGRQDGILDGEEFATKFIETLPDAELKWIEECGHVPHLEQPDETADAIFDFVQTRVEWGMPATVRGGIRPELFGIAGATAFAAYAADWIPFH